MSIVTFTSRAARHVRGTRVEVGQTLYAIRKGDLFFIWSYSDRAFAEAMDRKLTGPENEADLQANWRRTAHETTPSDRTKF